MFYIKRGDSETITTEPIETCDHQPVDLSAASVQMIIKRDILDEDSAAVLTKTVSHPDTNIVGFHLTPSETAALDVGTYIVGVRIVWDGIDGDVREIAREELKITQGVFNG